MARYTIGVDYGTSSCRGILLDLDSGEELSGSVYGFPSGVDGVIIDETDPEVARHEPGEYLDGLSATIASVVERASATVPGFSPDQVRGLAVATTGSTPIPVDEAGTALSLRPEFRDRLAAKAWLWKDHTGYREAAEITRRARQDRPRYVAACGGTYSAEWFWAKIWRCLVADPEVFAAAYSWVELCDFLVGALTGKAAPAVLPRSVTAAGHKAMYADEWGGLPDEEFLSSLHPELGHLRARLYERAVDSTVQAGELSVPWSRLTGLPAGTPVAVGQFDAHAAAIAGGAGEGVFVKVMGTSTCDLTVMPLNADGSIPQVSGICGVVAGSVLPGQAGVEAGQSAVGDIFNWFAENFTGAGERSTALAELGEQASRLRPGEHGLLALDWWNGNRSVLVDQRLTGLLVGMTLHTKPHHVYQALVEATAFGARRIIEQVEAAGAVIHTVVAGGGLPWHNPYLLQTYADVLGRPVLVAATRQGSARGAALVAAVSAGEFPSVAAAQEKLCGFHGDPYLPREREQAVYDRIYAQYERLHDAFGGVDGHPLGAVMKTLLDIRDEVPAVPEA
jgi:L-ribulokinase